MSDSNKYDVVALFSGGLDSILAAKLVEEQGRRVKCLHFTSPFFGKPDQVEAWKDLYELDIDCIDVSEDFVRLLLDWPRYGMGKVLNPCVDCKILLASKARDLMAHYGARCIISGEVIGQRPMSQRRDTLNIIRRDAGVKELLVRPLCALRLDPTEAELSGVLDRERLLGLGGRGRKGQMELAEKYGLKKIPTPAGGCLLTEVESARRYWPVLRHASNPTAADFELANIGRQYWIGPHWLVIGRNRSDNERLETLARDEDMLLKVKGFPGPLCLARRITPAPWPEEVFKDAAALCASFSNKAVQSGGPVEVSCLLARKQGTIAVFPNRTPGGWAEPGWEQAKEEKDQREALRLAQANTHSNGGK